jgi:hypothetical protein
MSVDVDDTATLIEDDEAASDAFAASFAATSGQPEAAPAKTEEAPADVAETETTDATEATPAEEAEPEAQAFTEAQQRAIDDAVARQVTSLHDKVYGKMGEFNRELLKLNERASSGKPITKEALKRLSDEYPDLAEALAEDLGSFMSGGQLDSEAIKADLDKRVEEAELKMGLRFLSRAHPTWKTDKASPEFKQFLGTLPSDVQQQIQTSNDIDFAVDVLDGFSNWRKAQAAKVTPKTTTKPTSRRIEAAITPKGERGSGDIVDDPEEAAAIEAFNKTMRKNTR